MYERVLELHIEDSFWQERTPHCGGFGCAHTNWTEVSAGSVVSGSHRATVTLTLTSLIFQPVVLQTFTWDMPTGSRCTDVWTESSTSRTNLLWTVLVTAGMWLKYSIFGIWYLSVCFSRNELFLPCCCDSFKEIWHQSIRTESPPLRAERTAHFPIILRPNLFSWWQF